MPIKDLYDVFYKPSAAVILAKFRSQYLMPLSLKYAHTSYTHTHTHTHTCYMYVHMHTHSFTNQGSHLNLFSVLRKTCFCLMFTGMESIDYTAACPWLCKRLDGTDRIHTRAGLILTKQLTTCDKHSAPYI